MKSSKQIKIHLAELRGAAGLVALLPGLACLLLLTAGDSDSAKADSDDVWVADFCHDHSTFELGEFIHLPSQWCNLTGEDVTFTTTMSSNSFFGAEHVVQEVSLDPLEPSCMRHPVQPIDIPFDTPPGTDNVVLKVTTSATGTEVIHECNYQPLTVVAPPTLLVPIRWCVIGDDANGNGVWDPGEHGVPTFQDPAQADAPDTDSALEKYHADASERTYLPYARVSFRSALQGAPAGASQHFPVIPDQDTSVGVYGDVIHPAYDDSVEWNATYNACKRAWEELLNNPQEADIGILAVVARDIVGRNGSHAVSGIGTAGFRRVLIEDPIPRWAGPGNPLPRTLAHEIGHALPTPFLYADGERDTGLGHICWDYPGSENNLMGQVGSYNSRELSWWIEDEFQTPPGEGGDASECTDDDEYRYINQQWAVRYAAQRTAGCKKEGTNEDCSTLSDVRTDDVGDVTDKFLDISMLFVTQPASNPSKTEFAHELFGILTDESFDEFSVLEYFVLADLDNNVNTGGAASDLQIPTAFEGADLVARVEVRPFVIQSPRELQTTATVWTFDETSGSFVEVVSDPSIAARVDERIAIAFDGSGEKVHTSDAVVIRLDLSDGGLGPAASHFRVQALSRGVGDTEPSIVDRLDDRAGEPGLEYRMVPPTFALCSVTPDPVNPGGQAVVEVEGLLPNQNAHVLFGGEEVASHATDGEGGANIPFTVPPSASEGPHVVAVGIDGTALSASCIVDVAGPVCDANGPYTAECAESVTLDGSGSDEDALSFSWTGPFVGGMASGATPTVQFAAPTGGKSVELEVDDGTATSQCMAEVTVQDTLPPSVTAPADVAAECQSPDGTTVSLGTPTVSDSCDASVEVDNDAPDSYPPGYTTVIWTATDDDGNVATTTQEVTINDTIAPEVRCNSPATLVPPDAPIAFTATATDQCEGDLIAAVTAFDCYALKRNGKRIDKRESCVVEIQGDTVTIQDSGGVGDHITWTVTATDGSGNASTALCEIVVVNPGLGG